MTVLPRNPNKVPAWLNHPAIEVVRGQLSNREAVESAFAGKDAAILVALGWGNTAIDVLQADTLPSLYLFETAAELGVKHLIYTSSTVAYGEHRPVFSETIQTRPDTFYGATKAATENYLMAISHQYHLRANTIRPGYTFGNPVVDGAFIYSDQRFRKIIPAAKANLPISLVKNDGTQLIWAGDLAKIYLSVLTSNHDRQTFNALGSEFTTWEEIARMAIDRIGSKSQVIVEDQGRASGGGQYDVSLIAQEFGFRFSAYELLKDHVAYLVDHEV